MITGQHSGLFALTEPPAHLVAVQLGHHDVEQDEVRFRGLGEIERSAPVGRRDDVVPVRGEKGLEQACVRRHVVDDEDPGAGIAHRRPSQCSLTTATSSTTSTGFET